jgi:hypothetical protein
MVKSMTSISDIAPDNDRGTVAVGISVAEESGNG